MMGDTARNSVEGYKESFVTVQVEEVNTPLDVLNGQKVEDKQRSKTHVPQLAIDVESSIQDVGSPDPG